MKGLNESDRIPAGHLSGAHIGRVVSFAYLLPPGGVAAVVTGELRQVYHTSADTILNLCSHTEDTAGEMTEFVLSPNQQVEVKP